MNKLEFTTCVFLSASILMLSYVFTMRLGAKHTRQNIQRLELKVKRLENSEFALLEKVRLLEAKDDLERYNNSFFAQNNSLYACVGLTSISVILLGIMVAKRKSMGFDSLP